MSSTTSTSCEMFTTGIRESSDARAMRLEHAGGVSSAVMRFNLRSTEYATCIIENASATMFQTGHTQRCRNRTNFSCSSCSKLIGSFKIFKRQSGRKLLSSAQGRVDSSLTSDILPRNTCRTPCQQVPFSHSEGLRFKWNNEMEFRKFRSFKFVGRMTFQHSCICAQRSQRSLRPTVESVDLLILLACTSLAK